MSAVPSHAAVYHPPRRLIVEERPLPEPGAGEARVRVRACGVCGTDLHFFHLGALAAGHVPGHEIAGVVDALGPGVSGLRPGEPVAVEPLRSCGTCPACRAGRHSICPNARLFGIHEPGGFAEHLVVPAARLFRVPADLSFPLAALAEPLAVCVHGVERGGGAAGKRVLVIGAGTIGLLSVLAARAAGAAEVRLIARHPHQAALGRALGASRVLPEAEATPEALARDSSAELVIETVGGSADTLRSAGAALAPGGSVSVLGVFTGAVSLDAFPLLLKEATLAWSNCYAQGPGRPDFECAIALLSDERERLAPLLTHQRPLGEIEAAFALASDKRAGAVKVTVLT